MSTPVSYRVTFFERDGVTPWFGSVDVYGEIVEADFQTPDPTLTHDRPYLKVPEGFSPSEVDFLNGSSRIGAGSVGVMDKRITATDQTTGLVTSRIKEAPGSRAILERWIDGPDVWRKILDGVVSSYTVDPDELLVYWFHLRDAREFEREQPLFFSNHILFGQASASGPGIDYGRLPGGMGPTFPHLVFDVQPFQSIVAAGINYFERLNEAVPADDIFYGVAPGPSSPAGSHFNLGDDFGFPTQDADGVYRFREFYLKWRAAGTSDPWVTLRNMPIAQYAHAVTNSNEIVPGRVSARFIGAPTLYFGSTVDAEIPATDQQIEFLIYATKITKESPFWWDGGTLGDLLQEIVAGDHTEDPPQERYDTAALAAFALSSRKARFRLTAPVTDRRRWVEENIYKASFTAPAFNLDKELRPVAWRTPTLAELAGVPVLDAVTIQPIGEWEHGTDNAVSSVEFTYIQEHVDPKEEAVQPRFGGGRGVPLPEVIDYTGVDEWHQLIETPITVYALNPTAPPGAQKLVYSPVTLRSIAGVNGRPNSGDTQDELGNQLVEEARATVFPRFGQGAPKYKVDVTATTANLNLYEGQWVLVRFPPLPSYATGKRGLSRYMQIYAITDVDPSTRRVFVVDGDAVALDAANDPTIVGTEDCLSGGALAFTPNGRAARVFVADGFLTNTCDHAVTLSAVLLIAGGGGGGVSIGGGGGAGGVLIAENVLVGAGEVIPITVGTGGAPATVGENSVLWVAPDGTALDPLTDPPPTGRFAHGGGLGGGSGNDGGSGGSGGGGGAELPGTGGGSHGGGGGEAGSGNDGGSGNDTGGTATCRAAAGGGGGSYAEAGLAGVASWGAPVGGLGGSAVQLLDWGVDAGAGGEGGIANKPGALGAGICGPEFYGVGASGGLYGGGGGGGGVSNGLPGSSGVVIVQYVGLAPVLAAPVVTTTEVTDENQVRVCIEEANWPVVILPGYQVRVEYAVGAVEPDAASGDWRFAGVLTAPGCVTTVAVPTGANVWTRAIAEAGAFPPSEPSTPADEPTPETPGLLAAAVTIDDAGLGTATWEPNAFALAVRVRGLIHASGDSTVRPLAFLADVDAAAGTYAVPGTVAEGDFETLDLEAWSGWGPDAAQPVALEDSWVARNSPVCTGSWATTRDTAGNEVQRTLTVIDVKIQACTATNEFQGIYRGILSWDCSTYNPVSVALTAVLTLRVLAKVETLAGQSVCLVGATPAAPGTHVATDYGQVGATLFSDDVRTLASISADTYITFTLNAAGLAALQAAIAAGGTPSFGLRIEADRTNTAPTWGSNLLAHLQVASLNHATSAYRPALVVTTAPVLSGSIGRIYRVSARRPVRTIALTTDVHDPAHGGTGLTAYVLGDTLYADAVNHLARLPGNITATKKFLRQTGTGTVSAAPAWDTVAYSDLTGAAPTWNQNTTGSAASLSAPLAYDRLPTGGGTWANGGPLSLTGGALTVGGNVNAESTSEVDFIATSNGGAAVFRAISYRAAQPHAKFQAAAARGTIASPAYLNDGDDILEIGAYAYDGTGILNNIVGRFHFYANGAHSSGVIPGAAELRLNAGGVGASDGQVCLWTAALMTVNTPIAINNTLNAVSPTAPNRTVTIVVGGTTIYLHGKSTND